MLCKNCMTVMGAGTRYEQKKGQDRPLHSRYYECSKCHDRVYINVPNFQEIIIKVAEKSRNK